MSSSEITRRHLAKIVESSDDAIISKDLNGIITSWNAAAESMFGYTAQEAIGKSIRMIIPADRQREEDFVLGRIRIGEPVTHYETVRQHKNGTLFPISLSVSPIYDDDGVVIGASKIARDITERTRLQQAAREQARITEKLSEVGAILAGSLDRSRLIQTVTDVATNLTQAAFGAFFYDAVDPHSGEANTLHALSGVGREALAGFPEPRTIALFEPTFLGQGPIRLADVARDGRYERRMPPQGLRIGPVLVRSYLAVPVKTPSGEVVGGLFFAHPEPGTFTVQHEQLAVGVAAWASVALENARLYLEAIEADRLKDEFLAVLSHELRTPLSAILGYARLLQAGVLAGEKATRGMETLERNAIALKQIVDDVLDVSSIVSGKTRLDVQPVDVALVVHNAITTVQPTADAKGVRLETIVDPRAGPISGDPSRLQQVVWNLLANAVKFTPRTGRVQIRLERLNSHVDLVVADTGVGIRREFLPHVFERFRQADAGTTRKSGGLGLGLSIVKHLVEMHGGSVDVASDGEGRGATFSVHLPLMIVQPERSVEVREHPRTERSSPLAPLIGLNGIRILALDDDADALNIVRVVLEAAGAEVVTMSSALMALQRLEDIDPHAMVVDVGMPEMDGFEFIRRVRALSSPAVRDIPAAALTAYARSDDRTKSLRAGFEMHLAKPVDPGELVASVATLVRRRSRHSS